MLLDDWKKYLGDPTAFDVSHFETLLTDTEYPVSPEQAFSLLSIPGSNELIRRTDELVAKTQFSGLYFLPKPENALKENMLLSLLTKHISEVADYLEDEGIKEPARLLRIAPISVTSDTNIFHQAQIDRKRRQSEAFDYLGDDFSDAYFDIDRRLTGVKTALLMMTMVPSVTNYILNGAVNFPVSFRHGFDLYLGGGAATYYEDETILFCPQEMRNTELSS
jgi:hypothetical protein